MIRGGQGEPFGTPEPGIVAAQEVRPALLGNDVLDLELPSGGHQTVLTRIGRPQTHDIAHERGMGVVLGQAIESGDLAAEGPWVRGRHRSASPRLAPRPGLLHLSGHPRGIGPKLRPETCCLRRVGGDAVADHL